MPVTGLATLSFVACAELIDGKSCWLEPELPVGRAKKQTSRVSSGNMPITIKPCCHSAVPTKLASKSGETVLTTPEPDSKMASAIPRCRSNLSQTILVQVTSSEPLATIGRKK